MHAAATLLAALAFTHVGSGPAGGTVWQGVIPGATQRLSVVYLPPHFSTSKRYPVVYLLHGMPGSPWSFANGLRLAQVADRNRPFIAVAPAAGPSGRYDGEWAGRWEDYVVADVVPWVDANLPTIPSARARTLAGLSAGGFGAVDIGLRHPGIFDNLESWSGYFRPIRDGELADADAASLAAHDPTRLVVQEAAALRADGTRFYLASGPSHGAVHEGDTIAFAQMLTRLRLAHRLQIVPVTKGMYRAMFAAGLAWALTSPGGAAR